MRIPEFFTTSFFLLLVGSCFGLQSNPDQQADPRLHKLRPAPFRLPEKKNQEQFLAYFTVETGWRTELQLRNNLSNSGDVPAQYTTLTVTPFARFANGQELQLADVTVEPGNVVSVDVESAIRSKLPVLPDVRFGSLVIRYNTFSFKNLYAIAMVHDNGYPIAFHIDGSGIAKRMEKGSREGIWWLPNDTARSYLVISNYTQKVTPVQIAMRGAAERGFRKNLTIGRGETVRLSLRQLRTEAGISDSWGSVSVQGEANAGGLDTVAFVYDEVAKFSAYLKMFDKDPQAKREERAWQGTADWTLRAPMVALSSPDPALLFPLKTRLDPKIFINNTSGQPIDYVVRLDWTGIDGKAASAKLPLRQIARKETQLLSLTELQTSGLLPFDAHWATASITATCQPEDLIAMTASYDDTMRYGVQNPFSDYLGSHLEGGKWQVDGMHNSISTVGNGTNENVGVAIALLYGNGSQKYEMVKQLGPYERMAVDIGQLIRQHVPDSNGNFLPADLTSGSYRVMETDPKGLGALFEGKVIVDKTFGSVTYGCFICCGPTDTQHTPYSPSLGVSDQQSVDITGVNSCSSSTDYITSYYSSWWTDNSGIVSAPSWATWQAVGAGTTTGYASGMIARSDGEAVSRPSQCYTQQDQPTTPVSAQVPTYFAPTSADSGVDGGCSAGAGGQFFTVHYQVLDQNGQPMLSRGISPQEHVTADGTPQPGYHQFSTPDPTLLDGKFDDDPIGTCFGPPKPSTNLCRSVTQVFQAVYNGVTYPISTTVSRRDCNNGSSINISGNPTAFNKTFSQGTVN